MAALQKIDSNVTGLRYAVEQSIGVLPTAPVWIPLEPNGYSDFGGQLTTIARNPINAGRQRKKGVVTDLDASGGFGTDVTQENMQQVLESFMFAQLRTKGESIVGNVDGIADDYHLANRQVDTATVGGSGGTGYTVGDVLTIAGGTATVAATLTVLTAPGGVVATVEVTQAGQYSVEPTLIDNVVTGGTGSGADIDITMNSINSYASTDLVFAKNFSNVANNGLKTVSALNADGISLEVSETLVDETPPFNATISKVGTQASAGDVDVDVAGTFPALTSTTLDFTSLGLIPGEWVFIGGDSVLLAFTNAVNNGYKRVRSVTTNRLEFDKSSTTMVTEASTSETIQIFFGRVLKNESDPALQNRQTVQLERSLGTPDDAEPSQIQAEYLPGSVANEFALNIPTADKMTADLTFVSLNNTQIDGPTALKTGSRPTLVESDAFNTSSDFNRIKMNIHSDTNENPDALFAFITDLTLTINNNVTPNKAVGVLGAFEVTAGQFIVSGSLTAYFSNVAAVQAVRDNSDVTVDFHLTKANAGISVDIPLIALGEGRLNVEQDAPITLPLSLDAATGAKIDTALDHTLLMVFFDYLPDAADA